MSKQKRLKKIIKGKLNVVLANGTKSLTTVSAQQSALDVLDSIAKASGDGAGVDAGDGLLLDQIGINNPGLATETLNIDRDIEADHDSDFAPFDPREVADADNDGIGNNQEIVNLYAEISAALIAADSLKTLGVAQLADSATNRTNGSNNTHPGGDETAYNNAEAAHDGNVTAINSIQAAAAAQVSIAAANVTAIVALPVPSTGITIDGEDPRTIHNSQAGSLQTLISTEKSTIDVQQSVIQSREDDFDADPNYPE